MLDNPEPPVAIARILHTHGHPQLVVPHCPHCTGAHRHTDTGLRTPACGRAYIVRLAPEPAHLVAIPSAA